MICPKCGEALADNVKFCTACGAELSPETSAPEVPTPEVPAPEVNTKKENVFTGIIGALIGAALGGASIVLLGQLGYIASISGLILAVCTLKGYELLGGKRSITGTILCIVLMLLTPYIADRISWTLEIMEAFSAPFAESFASVHEVVELNELTADYFKDLAMLYLFTVIGAIGTLRGAFQKK